MLNTVLQKAIVVPHSQGICPTRRYEIASADIRLLKRVSDGFSYMPTYSKTNQPGIKRPDNDKPLVGAAAVALNDWLKSADIVDGHIGGIDLPL